MSATIDFSVLNDQAQGRPAHSNGDGVATVSTVVGNGAPLSIESEAVAGSSGPEATKNLDVQTADGNPGASHDSGTKRHHGKPRKIVRGESSFRPGSSAAAATPRKPKALLYSIPTVHGKGDDSEFSELHVFINAVDGKLSQDKLGSFAALALEDGCWKLSFRLAVDADEVPDEFVSKMFQALDDINGEASFLNEGFGTARPASWAVTVGETAVDRGNF